MKISVNSSLDYCIKKMNFALYFEETIGKNKKDGGIKSIASTLIPPQFPVIEH